MEILFLFVLASELEQLESVKKKTVNFTSSIYAAHSHIASLLLAEGAHVFAESNCGRRSFFTECSERR